MNGIPLISTAASEAWVAWVMLLMLCLLVLSLALQPKMVSTGFRTLFTVKERDSIFITSTSDPRAELGMHLYGMGVVAMLMYSMFYQGQTFTPLLWLILLGCTLLVRLLLWGMQRVITYTFFLGEDISVITRHYRYLTTCMAVLLYPITLLVIYTAVPVQWIIYVLLGLGIFYIAILAGKAFVLFAGGLRTLLYIILYLCTVEILPIAILIYMARFIVNKLVL